MRIFSTTCSAAVLVALVVGIGSAIAQAIELLARVL